MFSAFALNIKEMITAGTMLAGILGVYFTGQLNTDAKISTVRQDVAVQATEQANIAEDVNDLKADIEKIDDKLNALLIQQGISPAKFENMSIATSTRSE